MKIFLLLLLLFFKSSRGFLLEGKTQAPPTSDTAMSDRHYDMLMDLLIEERQARRKQDQIIKNLQEDLLTTKKEVTLKYQVWNENNRSLEKQLSELKHEFAFLQNSYNTLKHEHNELQQKHSILENQTGQLEKEILSMKQLKSVSDLQTMFDVYNETKHLEQEIQKTNSKLNSVSSEADARKQDFLALLNKAESTEQSLKNMSLSLEHKWKELSDRVVLSGGAIARTYKADQVILFNDIVTANGIGNVTSFSNSGIFTCERNGLYQISVYIVSNSNHSGFYISKNNHKRIGDAFSSISNEYSTSTVVFIEPLNINDTIVVHARYDMFVYGNRESDLSILQVQ